MQSDIEIARKIPLEPIDAAAARLGIPKSALPHYGPFKAKIDLKWLDTQPQVLVTAIRRPRSALADALSCLGVRVAAALREPSLGPCFGMKGGATGGGHAQVAPMEDIKLPDKIRMVAQEIYRAGAVQFSTAAKRKLAHFEKNGFGQLPVGTPTGFTLLERDAGLARARALWWRSAGTS